MRKGGGKAKGSQFERDCCKALSLWVSNGTQEDVFWRSALSGGRSTVAHAKGKRLAAQAGDISCINPIGHHFMSQFMVECKFYKSLDIQGVIKKNGKLVEFWDVAKKEAIRYDKIPLLIAKQNQMPVIACLTESGLHRLDLEESDCSFTVPPINLYAVLFNDFINHAQKLIP